MTTVVHWQSGSDGGIVEHAFLSTGLTSSGNGVEVAMLLVGIIEHAFLSTGLTSSGNGVEVAMLFIGIA